jgi:uncharacterized membrane protein
MGELLTAQRSFLTELTHWNGVASKEDLRPTSFRTGAGRASCRKLGYADFDGHYWRITDAGRCALQTTEPRP